MENSQGEAVTMGVLLGFVVDELKVVVSRKTLSNYMAKHSFSNTLAIPGCPSC